MLFVFRTLNFFALGAIFLTPFWAFNSGLDRLLPQAPSLPHADTATARVRDGFVTGLGSLKSDIHADMCRRDGAPLCLMTICVPRVLKGRCP